MTTPATLNTKDVAEALGIEAKALRVFLRSPKGAGLSARDGKAYVFTKADLAKIKKADPNGSPTARPPRTTMRKRTKPRRHNGPTPKRALS